MPVQWPGSPVSVSNDVLDPLSKLLLGLNVLESPVPDPRTGKPADAPSLWRTPFSFQVITSGSTTISKWIGTIITGLGGTATALAAIRAFVGGLDDTVKVGWAAAAAACLVATILGLAIILRADITGRAEAAAAEYAARGAIAAQFLAQARPSGQYFVKKPGYGEPFKPVQGFVLTGGQIAVQLDGGAILGGNEVEGLVPLGGPYASRGA